MRPGRGREHWKEAGRGKGAMERGWDGERSIGMRPGGGGGGRWECENATGRGGGREGGRECEKVAGREEGWSHATREGELG